MPRILTLFLLISIATAYAQSEDNITRWISEADVFRLEKKYEEAASL